CQIALFKEHVARDVVLGRDGWLFYSGEGAGAEPFSGPTGSFTQQELIGYQRLLEQRRDWLAQRGVGYLFVVAPNKQSIYPEYLPPGCNLGPSQHRLDQFLAHMQQHSTVAVVDLRPALREAKRLAPTYFKTDTHWNDF